MWPVYWHKSELQTKEQIPFFHPPSAPAHPAPLCPLTGTRVPMTTGQSWIWSCWYLNWQKKKEVSFPAGSPVIHHNWGSTKGREEWNFPFQWQPMWAPLKWHRDQLGSFSRVLTQFDRLQNKTNKTDPWVTSIRSLSVPPHIYDGYASVAWARTLSAQVQQCLLVVIFWVHTRFCLYSFPCNDFLLPLLAEI